MQRLVENRKNNGQIERQWISRALEPEPKYFTGAKSTGHVKAWERHP